MVIMLHQTQFHSENSDQNDNGHSQQFTFSFNQSKLVCWGLFHKTSLPNKPDLFQLVYDLF